MRAKQAFFRYGYMDAQNGRSSIWRRESRINWPLWARRAYSHGWMSYRRPDQTSGEQS